jgi:hypothetical protein
VARDRCALSGKRVDPRVVIAAVMKKGASVRAQMLLQIATLHAARP